MAAVDEIEPIPVGVYTLRLVEYSSRVSPHRDTHEPREFLRLAFEVDEGLYRGRRLFDSLPLDMPHSDRAYPKYAMYAKAFGYTGDWWSVMQWIRDGYKCVGMTVTGYVRQRPYEGRTFSELVRVVRIEHDVPEPAPTDPQLVSVNFRCPEGCDELLTVPAEMISNESPASGAVNMTIRVAATTELQQHMITHWGPIENG